MTKQSDQYSRKVKNKFNQNITEKSYKIPTGVYRGIVVDNNDPDRLGRIKVQVAKFYGTLPTDQALGDNFDPELFQGAVWCRMMLPVGGTTSGQGTTTYGIFGQPPDVQNEVIVAFSGDSHSGIILGVLPDIQRQRGIAGPGVTRRTSSGVTTIGYEVPRTATSGSDLPEQHPFHQRLQEQGLDLDRLRGQNFASPDRDPSSRVAGITTPAGNALTLDDGNIEDGDGIGVRLRSAAGAQILMDDQSGFIYIVNSNGSSWVEINRNGDIDVFSGGSVNFGITGDFNVHAEGSINMQAARGVNIQAAGASGVKVAAPAGSVDVFAHANLNLQADANGNLRVAGNYRETAARIDMNGPPALAASLPTSNQLAGNTGVTQSIAGRVPEAEPWSGHLDVSSLDTASASGATSFAGGASDSYYYGSPRNPSLGTGNNNTAGPTGQSGTFDEGNFAPVTSDGTLLDIRPGVDMRVEPQLVSITEEVARRFGRPLVIVDGFRSSQGGGASNSQHLYGRAFDISSAGLTNQNRIDLIGLASSLGITGIGIYSGGSLHFDIRPSARAGWGDDWTRRSVPSYAIEAINRHIAGGYADLRSQVAETEYGPGDVDITQFSQSSQNSISELESDPEWRAQMDAMQARHGFDRTQMYQIIQGESAFNPTASNRSGAAGFFQIMPESARELGYTTSQIRQMSPTQQLQVYDQYLTRWNYSSNYHLGVMQAAPAFASSSNPNRVVYPVGSAAWNQNPGWRPSNGGNITIASISDYYNNQT